MTIEMHRPELDALIVERMGSGGFQNVEDVLMQALKSSLPGLADAGQARDTRTGADLIAAMQASPFREIEIEPERYRLPVRDAAF